MDRRGIHQLAATCKTNKKTTVVFRRPSDGKVSLFFEDLELRAAVVSIQDFVPFFLCDLLLFYGRRKVDPSFLESKRFLPIMLGEGSSYFGKDDLLCLLRNYLPDMAAARSAFLVSWRRADRLMGDLILIPRRAGRQPRLVELPIEKENIWVKRRSGYEMPGHPDGGLAGRSWAGWLLTLVSLGYPGGGSSGLS